MTALYPFTPMALCSAASRTPRHALVLLLCCHGCTASFRVGAAARHRVLPRFRPPMSVASAPPKLSPLEELQNAVAAFTATDRAELSGADAAAAYSAMLQVNSHLKRAGGAPPVGATGTAYDAAFLDAVAHLCPADTGTELMAPLIYSLVRSTRPTHVVELGCGYTTLWLAQALRDAAKDAGEEEARAALRSEEQSWLLWGSARSDRMVDGWVSKGSFWGSGKLRERARRPYSPTLHCVDSFGSDDWKAKDFEATARHLGLDGVINLHTSDWAAWEASLPPDFEIDFLWWDGFDPKAFAPWWERVSADGGLCLLHSTLSNHRNWAFVQELKLQQATESFRDFELLSLLEPHKWAQNSCTLLRKTSGYDPAEVVVRPHP